MAKKNNRGKSNRSGSAGRTTGASAGNSNNHINNGNGKREIKQVCLGEDGSERVVDTVTIESEPDDLMTQDNDYAQSEVVSDNATDNAAANTTDNAAANATDNAAANAPDNVTANATDNAAEVEPIFRGRRKRKSSRVHSDVHEKKHTGRAAAVAAALIFSLLLSTCVGGGLALWDEEKSLGDLNNALFNKDVYAATDSASDEKTFSDTKDSEAKIEADKTVQESKNTDSSQESEDVKQTEDGKQAEDDKVAEDVEAVESARLEDTDDFIGSTFDAENDSVIKSFVKAGSGDEITVSTQPPATMVSSNPNAKYPLPFTTVDESYFMDALFIGDSRLQGFGMWSGLPATFYCATGFSLFKYETTNVVQTENGKVPIFDALPYDAFTKIYIKVGLNEMGWDNEVQFEAKYAELIARLREYEPRAIIYVHGVLPVTAAKSASDKSHNNPNVLARNERLQAFAAEQKAYYIDAGPALSDESGNLRPEMTSDGIHLSAPYMKLWKQYLCEHAVVVR